ncbi:hypothetical protein [Yoonia sp. 2307UL14-13]|uniref:hypothetical protein n=1 Tax=Yoonia sp. 2307UL14-13 TaxID=3126506 RepID=UPI00309BC89E
MTRVEIHPSLPSMPLHPGWQDKMLADIGNAKLRDAVLGDERFATRIIADLLDDLDCAILSETGPVLETTKQVAERLENVSLIRIGQIWLAPLLAPRLISPEGRTALGIDDRSQLRFILKYQDHTDLSEKDHAGLSADYANEGAICIAAWLAHTSDATANRLKLCLPPDLIDRKAHDPARAKLIETLCSDAEFLES